MALEFGTTAEAQAAFDSWIEARNPPPVQIDLAGFEAEHAERFAQHHGRGVAQLYIAFDQLVALVDQVNFVDKSDWPKHRAIQFILIAKNLKAFHSALDRLTKGSYQDATTLTRTPYETFLRVVHVSIYGSNPWGALVDRPSSGVPKFNATGLAKDVLRLDWRKYGIMSPFAHSNLLEVVQSLRKIELRDGEPERFGLSYDDDPRLVESVLPVLQFLVLAYLRFVREVLIGSATVRDVEQLAEADLAIKWASFLLGDSPKPYWTQVLSDLEYILGVLTLADSGRDWKVVRDRRPLVAEPKEHETPVGS
jgi:hypothetical protein